jgi:hypothetical protein
VQQKNKKYNENYVIKNIMKKITKRFDLGLWIEYYFIDK